MGTMQLTEHQDAVRWSLDNRPDITAGQLTRWLNWSYLHVSMPRVHRHRALQVDSGSNIPLVLDQVTYNLVALMGFRLWGVRSVQYVAGSSSLDYTLRRKRLEPEDRRWFETRSALGTGEPAHYILWQDMLTLDRRPTATQAGNLVVVAGYREPARLVNATDTTIIADIWDEVIDLGARWRGWRELNRPERAAVAKADFATMIAEVQETLDLDAEDWGGRFEVDLTPYQQVS